MKRFIRIAICVAVALCSSVPAFAQDFQDPNTRFFSTGGVAYLKDGKIVKYRGVGYYVPARGDLAAQVTMLPRLSVRQDELKAFDLEGNPIQETRLTDAEKVSSVEVKIGYTGALPLEPEGAAIAAEVHGTPLSLFLADPLVLPSGQPVMFPPAASSPFAPTIISATQSYAERLKPQAQWIAKWKAMRMEMASLDGLSLRLLVDGEVLASRSIPGSAVPQNGRLPSLFVRHPTTSHFNRLRGGNYEVEVSYQFRDSHAGTITANYDFRQVMTEYVEQTQQTITKSRSSGFSIFNVGSSRRSISQHVKSEDKSHASSDARTSTVIEMEDADPNLISQFESRFFPELSKQKAIVEHTRAAEAAEQSQQPTLAKVHREYAQALMADNKEKELDSVGAAAALSSGNYAMFIAKGVRFNQSSAQQSNSFHRVMSARAENSVSIDWTGRRVSSVRRSVNIILEPERVREVRGWLGLCDAAPWLAFGRTHFVPTCIVAGSPLHRAGIQPGMLIDNINGHTVETIGDLDEALDDAKPGDKVALAVLFPDGKYRRYSVTLAEGLPAME